MDYKIAFYFALKDTLVCPNIDTGTEIAFSTRKLFRVVTLDGYLIEKSGTMSGGGRKKKGGMSFQVSSD